MGKVFSTCHKPSPKDAVTSTNSNMPFYDTLCRLALRQHGSLLVGAGTPSALTDGSVSHPSPWRPPWAATDRRLGNVKKTMLCFRRVAVVARVRCLAAGACRSEGASWRRHRHSPAAAEPLSFGSLSSPLLNGLKGTHGRYDCWTSVLPPHGAGLRVHQGSAATLRALLAPRARGLCSGKPGEVPPDGSPAPERKEDGSVPGHGLFKFKELVSGGAKVWHTFVSPSVVTEKQLFDR